MSEAFSLPSLFVQRQNYCWDSTQAQNHTMC